MTHTHLHNCSPWKGLLEFPVYNWEIKAQENKGTSPSSHNQYRAAEPLHIPVLVHLSQEGPRLWIQLCVRGICKCVCMHRSMGVCACGIRGGVQWELHRYLSHELWTRGTHKQAQWLIQDNMVAWPVVWHWPRCLKNCLEKRKLRKRRKGEAVQFGDAKWGLQTRLRRLKYHLFYLSAMRFRSKLLNLPVPASSSVKYECYNNSTYHSKSVVRIKWPHVHKALRIASSREC